MLVVLLIRPASPFHAVLFWLGAQLFISPYVLLTNAGVLHTHVLRPLRAGLQMLGAMLLASLAAFVVPYAIGEPVTPVSLIALRLLIAMIVGVPGSLLLAAAPGGLFRGARRGAAGQALS